MTAQLLQGLGALLILVPYALVMSRRTTTSSPRYLMSNFVGGTLLAILAAVDHDVGFVALEGAWAAVALRELFFGTRAADPAPTAPSPLAAKQRLELTRARVVAHDAWQVVFGNDGPCGCSTCAEGR